MSVPFSAQTHRSEKPKVYYTWSNGKKYQRRHASSGNYAVKHTSRPATGWGFGVSVNEYFGDMEYFGDLIPFNQWVRADWNKFGQGIAEQMGFDVHATYFDQINDYAVFRANAAVGLLRGTHYSKDRSMMAVSLAISDGAELYPAMDKCGFFFYLGGTLDLTYQMPKFGDVRYNSVGLLPMANIGIGYKIPLPNGGDFRIDIDYNVGLLDYAIKRGGAGKCAFTMSLDGYPATYIPEGYENASEEEIHKNFERGYNSQDSRSFWFQPIYDDNDVYDSDHFKWPDSYVKVSFTFRLGTGAKCKICRLTGN